MSTIAASVQQELHRIAPEVDIESIDADGDLREEFDIDSMDFLRLVTALGKSFNTSIPETDYPLINSYNSLCQYLEMAE